MKNLKTIARIFFGAGIIGLGVLHFLYPGFRPVILPVPPEATQHLTFFVYLTGLILVVTGVCILIGKWVKASSLLLAIVLLSFLLFGHLPNRLIYMPSVLGAWSDALKLLALAGGALIIAKIFNDAANSTLINKVGRWSFLGRYFFGLMLLIFGIDHFLYIDFVSSLVPAWIPGAVFWTYFAGVALIGSGLAFIINFKVKPVSILTGIMLLFWLLLIHTPRAVINDTSKDPNEIVSVFECLAFAGIAFLLYFENTTRERLNNI